MTQISANAPVSAPIKPVAAPVLASAEAPRTDAPHKAEDAAPIALAANGISRVIMDARAGYECGTKVEKTGAVSRDFDRLAYVLEGFDHMRRMIAATAEHTEAAPVPVEGMAQGFEGGLDITV